MATTARRRGYGDDSIYFDAVKQRWTGAVSLGHTPDGRRRVRRKVTAKTLAPRLCWPKVGEANRTLLASLDGWPHSLVMGSDLAVRVAVGSRG